MLGQKGHGLIIVVLIGVLIIAGVAGYYYFGSYKQAPNSNPANNTSSSPNEAATCNSNKDCGSGMTCQQVCLQTYPEQCQPGKCVPTLASPTPGGSGNNSAGQPPY